jgi:glutathione S-transferase
MWTKPKWKAFTPRLEEWMAIWETEAARHGVTDDAGWMLGTKQPGIADIVTSTLWSTMGDRFPPLQQMLDATAPRTAALCRRLQETPPLKALAKKAREDYGDAYCGGEIEKSLRAVVGS